MSFKPIPLSRNKRAFGGQAMRILPPMSQISERFRNGDDPWCKWVRKWFYSGLNQNPVPKPGIDLSMAMSNLACVLSSFEPKHEHKEAGVAYLASLWFESPNSDEVAQKKEAP